MENGADYMIYGNVDGIRNTTLDKLEELYDITVDKTEVLNEYIGDTLSTITTNINREISIALDRRGRVFYVAIGDATSVEVPLVNIKEKKLSGVRIIHTHPNGISRLSAVDTSALVKLKLDSIVALGVSKGKILECTIGFLSVYNNVLGFEASQPMEFSQLLEYPFLDKISHIEEIIKIEDVIEDDNDRAILISTENEDSLEELVELAKACEVSVIDGILQKRRQKDSSTYIGSGKVSELALLCQAQRANVVIFDNELTGSQVRNLEEILGVKVIDRTTLILEIFARRARTKEAKIQVELAQLKYRAAHLQGLGVLMSRTGAGIGTRGPGEKKLEIDKRKIKDRIYDLTHELNNMKKIREVQREKREDIPKVSIVGYTNAGKSTLRNKLCEIAMPKDIAAKDKVFEYDMLFATLDVTTRAIMLNDNRLITVSDTVGFIRNLPHELVESFKKTLEEVVYSDMLLHVCDAKAQNLQEQIEAVLQVLKELGAENKPCVLVFNKIDMLDEAKISDLKEKYKDFNHIFISAKKDIGLTELLMKISEELPSKLKKVNYIIPYEDTKMVSFLHRNGKIVKEEYIEQGNYISAMVDNETYNKTKKYEVDGDA